MQISFRQSGGIAYFPALEKPIDVDTSALPQEEAAALEGLITEVEVTIRASSATGSAAGGDRRHYIVQVDDGTPRSFTLQDPLARSSSELVRRLQSYRKATR